MTTTLASNAVKEIEARLHQAHKTFERRYPGDSGERQPVHVVYGGAHLFRAGVAKRFGELALRSMDDFAPNFAVFAKALGFIDAERLPEAFDATDALAKTISADAKASQKENPSAWLAHTVYQRVRGKLQREPVEDFRIDFEDGYGNRTDQEEDGHAIAAANEVSQGMNAGELPPFIGLRVKPLTDELCRRSIRTLDVFLSTLAENTKGELPRSFRVTLPKVTLPDEVSALVDLCTRLEPALGIEPGALRLELMIETPQAVINERGEVNLMALVNAACGRCLSVHFGPYDYTASRNIASPLNAGKHPASQFAREVMQVALARTGVWLVDGPTNIMPIPPFRPPKDGAPLQPRQISQNRKAVHLAWKLHFENIRSALADGYYQGWDLHPTQLPARYAAVYSFFLENLATASERMHNFIEKAAQATRVGQMFDDAAMAQGLLNYFLRAINSGAVTADETQALTTLTVAELRTGSFLKILEGRRA